MVDILSTWAKLKSQADSSDADVLERLARAYTAGYAEIEPQVQALTQYMDLLNKQGKLTTEAVRRSAAYKALIAAADRQIEDYSSYLRTEVRAASTESARGGMAAGTLLMLAAIAASLGIEIANLPRGTVADPLPNSLDFLREYLDPAGPLYSRINHLAPYHAENIAAGILEMVRVGKNPRIIGAWITDAYGMGLTDSLRIARTVQLYSYRQGNNAVQVANSQVLQGVVWCAELDDRVCMSCVALHGTVFPTGTICEDHHNGRCAMLPWVNGVPNPIEQTGEAWFRQQPEAIQIKMMGQGKFDAWRERRFEFDQLTTQYDDEVFGVMKREATLKELIGE